MPELSIGPEILQALQYTALAIIGYLAIIWLCIGIWTFNDIRQRTRNWFARILATLFVLGTGLAGVVLYMLLRPRETVRVTFERELEEEALLQDLEERQACPVCKRRVHEDYLLCPHCETNLKVQCRGCSRPILPTWKACPYCTTPVPAIQPEATVARPSPVPATAELLEQP